LIYNHFHWKRETKIAYLKEERIRLERKKDEIIEMVIESLSGDTISNKFAAELEVHMPRPAAKLYNDYLDKEDCSDKTKKELIFSMTIEMSKALADIDDQIKKLLS
jgi:hypothetical protein